MNNLRALVVFYDGPEIPGEHLKNISEFIATTMCLNDMPVVYTLDERDIISSVITATNANQQQKRKYTPAEEACIYIGELFASELSEKRLLNFASSLSSHIAIANLTNSKEELRKAVAIIGGSSIENVRDSIRSKYNITKTAFEIIQNIAKNV